MESLLLYEIDPTETSKILANNVIKCLEAQPPSYASRPFLEVNSRWLNGELFGTVQQELVRLNEL